MTFSKIKEQNVKKGREMQKVQEVRAFLGFRERECHFSLRSRAIRPLDRFESRRRVVLLGEDNAWTTVLGSFFKLLEVGVSSYLFYSWFKCFVDVCVGLRP